MWRSPGSLPPQPAAGEAAAALRRLAAFLGRALPLCRAHATQLYARGLWQRLVAAPPDAVLQALRRPLREPSGAAGGEWDDDTFSNVFCENSKKLINVHLFALAAEYYSLSHLGVCTPLEELLKALGGDNQGSTGIKTDEFMNNKKSHEVQVMSELVDKIANYCGIKQCNSGELREEEKAQRKMASIKAKASKSSESNLYFPLTSYITAETELRDIIADLENCIMVGLHTCGDLAANTLRIFTAKPEIKAVCSVGCCYHLLSEQYENQEDCTEEVWGFPMCQYLKDKGWCCGRNARMSACLALERIAVGQMLPTDSLFYRAVLQVIIEEIYGVTKSERHVGKIFSKSSSFLDYVRKSLKKLELDDSKLPDSCIMDYYEKYKHRMNELEAFNMLKVVLAPCIEVLILLDRLCYLKEQDNIAWSGLVKLFDPVKSPRCYAVIALKK
ncbi:methyltransferase-like protein 25 isoform X2 [Oxyura jamaicensis]|uniref:methyltransferase-like protein 25 isoform X2 n=1 Tax=Oxyura jamaicensis TaxID=8884 RepID=UPI0015A52F83|nr:methyltransferase-like protein 25 isoform X2 [Oxyura jamaicensis]